MDVLGPGGFGVVVVAQRKVDARAKVGVEGTCSSKLTCCPFATCHFCLAFMQLVNRQVEIFRQKLRGGSEDQHK